MAPKQDSWEGALLLMLGAAAAKALLFGYCQPGAASG
jgi:hypothetical protein